PRALHRAQVPGAVRMTDATVSLPRPVPQGGSLFTLDGRVKRRNAAEARFRAYGMTAIVLALMALVWLLYSIFAAGLPAFQQTFVTMPVMLDPAVLDKNGNRDPADLAKVTTVGDSKAPAASLVAAAEAAGLAPAARNPDANAGRRAAEPAP